MIDHYDWSGGREAMVRFGPAHGPVVVATLPLLEEWNRTRTFAVTLLRALAARGVASVLPDLPGHGESLTPAAAVTLPVLVDAVAAVARTISREGRRTFALGLRGGALLHAGARHDGGWLLAPVTGPAMLRDLRRTWLAGVDATGRGSWPDDTGDGAGTATIAGTAVSAGFLRSLAAAGSYDAVGTPCRIVRLATDPQAADRHVDGPPLWRRSEPSNDPLLAATLADDLADWIAACAG